MWWSTDPDPLNESLKGHKTLFDEVLVPDYATLAVPPLADSDGQFKVVFTQLSCEFLERFANLQTYLRVHARHRNEEQESEVVIQLRQIFGHLVLWSIVLVICP